ncbi:potassium channel family protein [Propionibacteriaceae bacterium Y1923]|uniref:potassium channel family protein n=1 Tax=Aestuariimicrobium sp. Y1814 TaxID=3418742 RepID=UPI003C208894
MARSASRGRRQGWRDLDLVSLPQRQTRSPITELLRRFLLAMALLLASTLIVWLDREAYVDNVAGDGVSFIDALYYSTVTVTTTGYGDITPLAPHARLINALLVTPLRISFLVVLVGTTLEVLANEGRRGLRDSAWRKTMRNHTVVIGYGTKGRSAVATLLRHNISKDKVVVIDDDASAVASANHDGLAAFHGDATERDLLRRAEITKAREVIITLDRDAAAILTVLTVRQLNPRAHIVVAVREQENVPLLRQSGADQVVTSSDAVGRLMGLSSVNPHVGAVMEDLLSNGEGLEVSERQVTADEVGLNPRQVEGERVLAVIRNDTLRRYFDSTVNSLQAGDRLVIVRRAAAAGQQPVISSDDDF